MCVAHEALEFFKTTVADTCDMDTSQLSPCHSSGQLHVYQSVSELCIVHSATKTIYYCVLKVTLYCTYMQCVCPYHGTVSSILAW